MAKGGYCWGTGGGNHYAQAGCDNWRSYKDGNGHLPGKLFKMATQAAALLALQQALRAHPAVSWWESTHSRTGYVGYPLPAVLLARRATPPAPA